MLKNNTLSHSLSERLFGSLFLSVGLICSGLVFFIIFYLGKESLPALSFPLLFNAASNTSWHPLENSFGMIPMVIGSLLVTFLALGLCFPLSLLSAIAIQFYTKPKIRALFNRCLEVVAGLPSVFFGLWGISKLVPLINNIHPPGASLLAATLVLTLMIVPTTTLLITQAFDHFPDALKMTAHSLGLNLEEYILKVVLPFNKKHFLSILIIGFGRAIGETIAVLMVAGNVVQIPNSIFAPFRTITSNIALEMAYAMGEHRSLLFLGGLLLSLASAGFIFTLSQTSRRWSQ